MISSRSSRPSRAEGGGPGTSTLSSWRRRNTFIHSGLRVDTAKLLTLIQPCQRGD